MVMQDHNRLHALQKENEERRGNQLSGGRIRGSGRWGGRIGFISDILRVVVFDEDGWSLLSAVLVCVWWRK